MLRMTTKQLMDQSKCFTFMFWGAIATLLAAVILTVIWPFTSCMETSIYSCSSLYPYPYVPNECISYGTHYCCPNSYSYCGSSQCYVKPSFPTMCIGVIIAAWCLYSITFFMAIFVFIMFCNLRNKARIGVYSDNNGITNPLMYNNNPQLILPNNNPIVYSDAFSQPNPYLSQNQQITVGH